MKIFNFNKKSHRILLFLLVAIPTLLITLFYVGWVQFESPTEETGKVEVLEESVKPDSSPSQGIAPEPKKENKPIAVKDLPKEEINASKLVAEKFARAYGTYDQENPSDFVQNASPYLTEGFKSQWEEEPPRKPLALKKSKVAKLETFPIDGGDAYTIGWNVILTEDTVNVLDDKVIMEEWLWILLVKENGQWKVKGVEVNNG